MRNSIAYGVRGAVAAAVIGFTALAQAAPVTPIYDTFGSLPYAQFGGNGIPNDWVAISKFDTGDGKYITLGLTAHQRYDNPALTNDKAGTFYAEPGSNIKDGKEGSLWNFAWNIKGDRGVTLSNYNFRVFYDFNPETGTDQSALGSFNPNLLFGTVFGGYDDSQNLMFGSLSSSFFANTPDYPSFNPGAEGEYSFALIAYNKGTGAELDRAAINVIVGQQPTQVPEPAGLALFGLGLLGMGFARRFTSKG